MGDFFDLFRTKDAWWRPKKAADGSWTETRAHRVASKLGGGSRRWEVAVGGWRAAGFVEVEELGAGVQGRVVLAEREDTGERVAIKYLFPGQGAEQQFLHEMEMLTSVRDPHVVWLQEVIEGPGGFALVMEAVEGGSLRALLDARGRLPSPEAALAVLKGSLLGLQAAHERGIVHRDYKPANVIVERSDGLSKLVDFGIAVRTGHGSRSGTPAYMAPEQWRGEPITTSADVYAATCVFFECLTGQRPFEGDPRTAHLSAPPRSEMVPEPVRGLVEAGMAKEPASRPPSAGLLAQELETVATAEYGPDWERRGLAALAAAVVALSAAGVTASEQRETSKVPSRVGVSHAYTALPPTAGRKLSRRALLAITAACAVLIVAVAAFLLIPSSDDSDDPPLPLVAAPGATDLAGTYALPRAVGTLGIPTNPVYSLAQRYVNTDITPITIEGSPSTGYTVRGFTDLSATPAAKIDFSLTKGDNEVRLSAIDPFSDAPITGFSTVIVLESSGGKATKIDLGILFGIVDPYLHWYGTRQ